MNSNKTFKFNSITTAMSFVNRATKIWMVVLGDDMKFWVVTPAEAAKLEKAGYEVIA